MFRRVRGPAATQAKIYTIKHVFWWVQVQVKVYKDDLYTEVTTSYKFFCGILLLSKMRILFILKQDMQSISF